MEVSTVVDIPAEEGEAARLVTIASFVLSRYSGQVESTVLSKIVSDAAEHASPGAWFEHFGAAAAVFTRTEDALVVKAGKLKCE